ncbi:MAG: DUF4157 domain-containing protein [Gammaproteobacteria bacterium]|nr:DUF4157 domain-containing protein [Gammaproteobacteria bacterium]
MEAAVQSKEDESSAKATQQATPEPQAAETAATGITAGMPLYLGGGTCSTSPLPPGTNTARAIQCRVEAEEQDEEELLQAKCCVGTTTSQPQDEESFQPARPSPSYAQAKLTLGPPDDEYEDEANQVADMVMRMPQGEALQSGPKAVQTHIDTPRYLQYSSAAAVAAAPPHSQSGIGPSTVTSAKLARAIESPAGGRPLLPEVQARVGRVLGHDLSHVRVHSDTQAGQAAQAINAKAFTHKSHVYLGDGQSEHELGLMAHEATHVVQQGAGQGAMVQRNPNDDEAEDAAGEAPSVVSPARRREANVGTFFSQLPERSAQQQASLDTILDAYELYRLIEQKEAMERRFAYQERRGMGIVRFTSHNMQLMQRIQSEIDSECQRLGLANEMVAKTLIRQHMPVMVLRRAKQAAIALLNKNEAMARAEMERYSELVCSPDIDGLLDADGELAARRNEIQMTQYEIERASMYISAVPAGVPTTAEEYGIPPSEASIMYVISRIDEYRERLSNQQQEYEQMRARFGQAFPILLTEGYEPGRFSSAPPEQLAQLTAEPLQEIIENIHDVKEAVREDEMKVWNMQQVIDIAITDMGIAAIPEYVEIVTRHIERQLHDSAFMELVKSALAITTTVIAGLIGGPLGAGLVGGAWGGYFLSESAGRYMMESAAENVAMDPAVRDISVNEPELIWVVVDVVGLGLEVGPLVRTIRPLARSALRTRRIAEFARAVRRIAPDAAERLIGSLRRRLGREAVDEGADAARAAHALGEGRNLDEYLQALRAERHEAGTVGRSWDYDHHPQGLPDSRWQPGDPIDMPNTQGTYPAYDRARGRYWRNRAHFELEARARGGAARRPGVTTDPVSGLSDDELRRMRDSGRAPEYAFGNRAGQTWELEHHGVPQRVGGWLRELGFDSPGEASRLIEASRPGSLMEVTPLEHAFFDVEAHGFGRLRADVSGVRWGGTAAADVRGARPLYHMSDDTIREIVARAANEGMDFSKSAATRQLRDALESEISSRGLGLSLH